MSSPRSTADYVFDRRTVRDWADQPSAEERSNALEALETGKILYFPELAFALEEAECAVLDSKSSDGQSKNVSYDPRTDALRGTALAGEGRDRLAALLRRFSSQTLLLVSNLFPAYSSGLQPGRASLRPLEVADRQVSWRKDDRRLHVDAFPSQPLQGRRILRVFSNINPEGAPRVWRVGEPFTEHASRFLNPVSYGFPGSAMALALLGVTKGQRAPYDRIMLSLHDRAKADEAYQRDHIRAELSFGAGSTWIVFTDAVPHAAIAGRHALEQTFYLPVTAMHDPARSPLRILEGLTNRRLAN